MIDPPVLRSTDLDLNLGWNQRREFLRHALTRQHDFDVQILPNINVTRGFNWYLLLMKLGFLATEPPGTDSAWIIFTFQHLVVSRDHTSECQLSSDSLRQTHLF